jgi:UPF0755 protein
VTHREPDSLIESDPSDLLFGPDDEDYAGEGTSPGSRPRPRSGRRPSGSARSRRRQRSRSRRIVLIVAVLIILVVGVTAAVLVPKIQDWISTPDYGSGSAGATVQIVVQDGESAADIADTLHQAGVVKSAKAFVEAAKDNTESQGIQPGTYSVQMHLSGATALEQLLDPANRQSGSDLAVPEGANTLAVEQRLVTIFGTDRKAEVVKAIQNVADAGLPLGYGSSSGELPTSVEGFLYPATYNVGPKATAADIVQKMTGAFIAQDRSIGFATASKKAGLTPYEALTIASVAQAEAKFPEDMPKVVRVILNRIKAQRPLQVDATTVYGAELKGKTKNDIDVSTFDSPYNSYIHAGLPPTPISNPGPEALDAAVHPAAGNWLYYVNGSDDGHLYFTASEEDFGVAKQKCIDNDWGCG